MQDSADEWSEQHDPTHGRAFWFNSRTGESTWTRPAVLAQPRSEPVALMPSAILTSRQGELRTPEKHGGVSPEDDNRFGDDETDYYAAKIDLNLKGLYDEFADEDGDMESVEVFVRFCEETKLIGDKLSEAEAIAIYGSVKSKKGAFLTYPGFKAACQQVAARQGLSFIKFTEFVTRKAIAPTSQPKREDKKAAYRHLSNLGAGAFGGTIKVERKSSGEVFAAKLIRCHGLDEAQASLQEVMTMKMLQTKQFVRLEESFISEAGYGAYEVWIVMELCERSLQQEMQRAGGPIDEKRISLLSSQVLDGLRTMHGKVVPPPLACPPVAFASLAGCFQGRATLCSRGWYTATSSHRTCCSSATSWSS